VADLVHKLLYFLDQVNVIGAVHMWINPAIAESTTATIGS